MNIISRYFDWLQRDNPVGDVVLYPELSADGETSLKGVYIAGDLTGIPLLKLAANGAATLVKRFSFEQWKQTKKVMDAIEDDANFKQTQGTDDCYDIVIIGAGPAGIAAAIEAKRRGYRSVVLEASDRPFHTIENFPKGKPMFYEPKDAEEISDVTMRGETKEALLAHLKKIIDKHQPNIAFSEKVDKIELTADGTHRIITERGEYHARKTILASGKSGHSRKLGVPGEDLPHVSNHLYDPNEFTGKRVLIVGGGDSALESAALLQKAGAQVTLSYRSKAFTRPKPDNIAACMTLAEQKKITLLFESTVKQIRESEVEIDVAGSVQTLPFDNVFTLIGTQLPYEFFEKSGIKIENARTHTSYWWLAFVVSFMNVVYFGKASGALASESFGAAFSSLFSGSFEEMITKVLAWLGLVGMIVTLPVLAFDVVKNWRRYIQTKWHAIKHAYFFAVLVLFLFTFFGSKYFNVHLGDKDPYFWYSFLYTTTIALFGLRRIVVTKKRYVTVQTIVLFLIQALPLFVIPNFVLPWMDAHGWISPWVREHVFLGGEWWRFVGFILAWPLFIWNIFTDQPSVFWLVVSLVQTFVIIPFLVVRYGKGAYCGWICSCGAMAETLGDEYRTLAPHGARAKQFDNMGQIVLFTIFSISILHALGWVPSLSGALAGINHALLSGYKLVVDTFLAGTIGLGLYFVMGGRVWCRFFCPLAALMHVYNKFATWRILADKKKCISCGLCTKSCHMGIDVMSYAQSGRVLDDVECVNCSACINVCPTGVLSFGRYKRVWNK